MGNNITLPGRIQKLSEVSKGLMALSEEYHRALMAPVEALERRPGLRPPVSAAPSVGGSIEDQILQLVEISRNSPPKQVWNLMRKESLPALQRTNAHWAMLRAGMPQLTSGSRTIHPVTGEEDTGAHGHGLAYDVEWPKTKDGEFVSPEFFVGYIREMDRMGWYVSLKGGPGEHATGRHVHHQMKKGTYSLMRNEGPFSLVGGR
tara:strand:- start:372 stop:983 length:612 start_codon:yes stop_codon:yes gene_type:complete